MKTESFEKLEANINDKTEYDIQIRNLKQAINCGMSKFNQNTCEKPYIDLKTDLRKKSKK